jgi:hypothetical protein
MKASQRYIPEQNHSLVSFNFAREPTYNQHVGVSTPTNSETLIAGSLGAEFTQLMKDLSKFANYIECQCSYTMSHLSTPIVTSVISIV